MDSVQYTLVLQRILMVASGVSFALLCGIITLLDPFENSLYVWAFIGSMMIFLTASISLLSFFYSFTISKQLLSIQQVNTVVYQSLISSVVLCVALVLLQTGYFNFFTVLLLSGLYLLYWIWMSAKSTE